jgi:hypothetical protein
MSHIDGRETVPVCMETEREREREREIVLCRKSTFDPFGREIDLRSCNLISMKLESGRITV